MNISEIFIRKPIATSLLMMGILIFGIAAYPLLPVAALPRVDFPTLQVSATLPGASPDTMASSVATPLEQQFAAIPGLTQMTSTSALGSTMITLQFDLDRGIDGAAGDVQTAINAAGGLLPKDLPNPPTYKKTNPADRPILIYAVYSDSMPIYRLDDYAFTILAQKLSTVTGVSEVDIAGQQQYAAHIQVNPAALASRGIGLEDVHNALAAATLDEPKGNLEGANQAFTIDTNDQLMTAQGYANVIVAYRNGAPVRVKDIGKVIDSSTQNRIGAWYRGHRAEVLFIRRQPGANTVETIREIQAMLPAIRASIPPSIKIDLISDRSQTVTASLADVQFTLMLTIALVVMVIFLFLRNVWATVIPSVTVPLSIVATFGVMYALNYSLDNLSLMAITISVGFVVDDAIVMIENIVRYVEEGDSPFEAAIKGAGQIGFTIISITVSLCAVFIPLLFMSGIVGRLFREFAVTVTVAVMVSGFISLTLTPMMCSLFLTRERKDGHGRFYRAIEGFFEWLIAGYDHGLKWVFRNQFLTLMSTLALIVLTGVLYVIIPKGFFPEQDTGFLIGSIEARQDSSFAAMSKIVNEVADVVSTDPAVQAVVAIAGATGGNTAENTGRFMIELKDFDKRSESAQDVIERLRPKMAQFPAVKWFLQSSQDVTVGGRTTQTEYQYTLSDTDTEELNTWAPRIQDGMRKMPELQDIATDQQIASPHIVVDIDRDAAYRLGLSLSLIDQTLYDAFGQRQVATIYTSTSQYKVILEVQPEFQNDVAALSRIYVPGPNGAQVPLSAIAHLSTKVEPMTVNHQGQFPSVTLSFNVAPGVSLGQAVEKIQALQDDLRIPQTLLGTFQGNAQAFQSSLSSTPLLIAAAILVMYIILGMLYESYIHPLTILSALPSAGVGALISLMAFGYDLSVIALIGIILLIGIVKKNAIMMIDFALEAERKEGKTPLESIHEACLLRFRPIMMTTMAALLGGLPLALGTGAGSELRRPLGIAIVGGLIVSQFLTLYTTPVIYLYMDRVSHWLAQRGLGRSRKPLEAVVATHEAAAAE
jgi:hydrophobe/amphiphile efflux-1 (HAE1) family protein